MDLNFRSMKTDDVGIAIEIGKNTNSLAKSTTIRLH